MYATGADASFEYTYTITAAQIIGAIEATGDQLSTADAVYAISHLIIKPDGLTSYTLSNPATSVPGWTNSGVSTPRITNYAYAYDPANYQANKYAEYYFPVGMAPGNSTAYVLTDQSDMSRFPALYEHDNNYSIGKAPCCSSFTLTVDSDTVWDGSVKFYVEGYRYPSNYYWDPSNYYSSQNITETNFAPVGSSLYDLQHNQNGGYSAMMSADVACPIPGGRLAAGLGHGGADRIQEKNQGCVVVNLSE